MAKGHEGTVSGQVGTQSFLPEAGPRSSNEAIVERWWVAFQGPVHLRPIFHDCGQIARCSKGQRLVTCFLLCFRANSGNCDLLSGIILFFFPSNLNLSFRSIFLFFKVFLFGSVKMSKPMNTNVAH